MDSISASEIAKTASTSIDYETGTILVTITVIVTKLIDKLPIINKLFGQKKNAVSHNDIALAIAEHSLDCKKCMDSRFVDTIKEFKSWREEDLQWRKLDIYERRTFRTEMLNSNIALREEMLKGFERVDTKIERKADK